MMIKQFFLQHDKARPHTSLPFPYSPDLAPSDFQIFRPLKNELRGSHVAKNLELKHSVITEL